MPERAYRKMVISLKRNSTFVEAAQFCNCCILFSGLSAPPVTCPYRAEQATGLAGGYDCIFGAKSSVFPPLPHHSKFRNFFDHIFDHSWSGGESFGCFCSGTLCSRKTKFKRFPEIFPPRTFFLVYCVSKFKRENDCRLPFSLTVSIKEATAILLSAYLLLQIF